MTGADLRAMRENSENPDTWLPWTGGEVAALIGVHPQTYYRWERDELPIPKATFLLLRLLFRGDVDIGDLID